MKQYELELAATLLELASEQFSNHSCNDLDLPPTWTQQECDDFTLEMAKWNGDPQNHEPGKRITMDFAAMAYLSAMLMTEAEEKEFPR